MKRAYRMLSTSGILGYGFPEASFQAGIARKPDMIGVDGGSTDPGPHYLGSGESLSSRRAMKRDLHLMLRGALDLGVPLVIGTAGGAGGEPHLQRTAEIVRELAKEGDMRFRLALIHAEQDAASLQAAFLAGRITPLRNAPEIDQHTFGRAERSVGMMGAEPFAAALDGGAQVILAGRSSDAASWAGCAIRAGVPKAAAWFAGKMLECGAAAADPVSGSDCLLVEASEDGVIVEATNPARRCTPKSVAMFSLHENASPISHTEPGGQLLTDQNSYTALSERVVQVNGMRWIPAEIYTIKLESAELVGFRTFTVCGTRDPRLIRKLSVYLAGVRERVRIAGVSMGISPEHYTLTFRNYGIDAVMGTAEPTSHALPHEVGFVVDTVATTQEMANAIGALARTYMLHGEFEGRLCTEGNVAFPFSPADVEAGPVFGFGLNHVMAVDDPLRPFPIEYEEVQ